MVQRAGKDECDHDHGHHEPDRQRPGTIDFAAVEWTKTICENFVTARELLGTLIRLS